MTKVRNNRIGRKKTQLTRRQLALAMSGIEQCVRCGAPGEIGAPFVGFSGNSPDPPWPIEFQGRPIPVVFRSNPPGDGYFAFCEKCDSWSGSVPLSTLTPYMEDGAGKWVPLGRGVSP